jgi:gliding motility-associated-like protein
MTKKHFMLYNYDLKFFFFLLIVGILCSSYTLFPHIGNNTDKKTTTPQAGLDVSSDFSVKELVRDVFIKGGCKNVFNIQAIGKKEGIGFFNNGTQAISLNRGIILATGPIENAVGPNTLTDKSGDFADFSGDIDLDILANEKVRDAVGIEFDFIPLESTVTFSYVFASEEYCEFVGSKFNDVFGFFVSGPGIEGEYSNKAKNVALIPGTGDLVEINSVNHLKNSGFYVGNELQTDAFACSFDFNEKPTLELIEYDGYTTVLKSILNLIPCETYHIRLVVADRGDHFYDSAVFLGANSFNLGGEATISAVVENEEQLLFEGCSDSYFLFERVDVDSLAEAVTVPFKISPASSAIENEDFDPIPRTIEIPVGEASVALPINAIVDGLPENFDTLILELDYPCECRSGDARLTLADPPPLRAAIPEWLICPGDEIELQPEVFGGNGPYTYEWDNGDTSKAIMVAPSDDTQYSLRIWDNCEQQLLTSTFVRLIEPAEAVLAGDQEICEGSSGRISINFSGEAPWSVSVLYPDSSERSFSGIQENPFYVEVEQPGRYALTEFSDGRCSGVPLGEVDVKWSMVEATTEVIPPSCYDSKDGSINLNIRSGTGPYDFFWSDNTGTIEQTRTVGRGTYSVSITDGNNCVTEYQVEVGAPEPLGPVLYDCANTNISLRSLKAQGGSPPYLYSTNGINFSTSLLFEQLDPGSLYDLTIKDQNGCLYEQPFQLPTGIRDFVRLERNIIMGLGDKRRLEPELLVPRTLIDSVSWYPEDNLTCSDCLDPILTAVNNDVYKMEVYDIFGCKDTATIEITLLEGIQVYVPTAFSPDGDGINDLFQIFGKSSQIRQIEVFRVYDRWGNLLHEARNFQAGDQSAGWNGRINGKKVNTGTYIYNIIVELIDGTRTEKNGSVLLMR